MNGVALVVDDNELMRDLLVRLISKSAPERMVVALSSGDQACAIDVSEVSLAVVDLNLPGGANGQAVIRRLRERHPEALIVAITGYAGAGLERPEGADLVMLKPLSPSDLRRLSGAPKG